MQCGNNLKQLGLAMLQHEETYKRFPSGGWGCFWVGDPDRGSGMEQPGSWLYGILPYMDQTALYELGSDGDPNAWTPTQLVGSAQRVATPLAMMNCPTRRPAMGYPAAWPGEGFSNGQYTPKGANPVSPIARGDYAACAGDQYQGWTFAGPADLPTAASMTANNTWPDAASTATGICYLRSEITVSSISDGLSNTYMLGEKYLCPDNYATGMDPGDNESMYTGDDNDNQRTTYYDPSSGPTHTPMQDQSGYPDSYRFGSAHSGGCNMALCDGSVRSIGYSIDAETHRRLGNRKDGQPVRRG